MSKSIWLRIIAILITILGLISAVVTILAAPPNLRVYAFLALGLSVSVLFVWFIHNYPKQPVIPVIPRYKVSPATAHDITWIADLEKKWFLQEAIPKHTLEEWYGANPGGFFVIKEGISGKRVGHLDLLPIKPKTLMLLREGEITESGIRADSLYGPDEKSEVTALYIESLIVDVPNITARAFALRSLLQFFDQLMQSVCDPARIEYVYAMAATKQGARLMNNLGFKVIKKRDERVDHHDFYAAPYSELSERVFQIIDNDEESQHENTI